MLVPRVQLEVGDAGSAHICGRAFLASLLKINLTLCEAKLAPPLLLILISHGGGEGEVGAMTSEREGESEWRMCRYSMDR